MIKHLLYPCLLLTMLSCQNQGKNSDLEKKETAKKTLDSLQMELELIKDGILPDETKYESEDCSYWVTDVEDKMTGKRKIKSSILAYAGSKHEDGKEIIPKTTVEVSSRIDGSKVAIYFNVIGLGSCIDEEDKINLLFTDDSRMTFVNGAEYNCDGAIVVWLTKSSKKLKELKEKKIKTLRPTVNGVYVDLDVDENTATIISKSLNCISK